MLVEAGQIMSHAMIENGYEYGWLYAKSYEHHPLMDWCSDGKGNFAYVRRLAEGLYEEKVERFGGGHKTWRTVVSKLPEKPDRFPEGSTDQYQAMPDVYRQVDPVEAYRLYYKSEKMYDGAYDKASQEPSWL
jgi:hypothetical protein